MKAGRIFFLFFCFFLGRVFAQQAPTQTGVGFIENKGQVVDQNGKQNKEVRFLFNGRGLNIQLRLNGFSYDSYIIENRTKSTDIGIDTLLDRETNYLFHRVDVVFIDANPNPEIVAENQLNGYTNYYTGGNAEQGVLFVRKYGKIIYKNLYNGIDLEFLLDKENNPKYNFIVHAGADASKVKWKYEGANKSELLEEKIVLGLRHGDLIEHIPVSYTLNDSETVDVRYNREGGGIYGFRIPDYLSEKTLLIDPQAWATFYGGSAADYSTAIVIDNAGNVCMSGYTSSSTSISTSGAYQTSVAGSSDVMVVKFSAAGVVQWATYYGGTSTEYTCSMATDTSNNIYIIGQTSSSSGISTSGVHQSTYGGGSNDAFLAKFNSSGVLQWGTYYGGAGSDLANSGPNGGNSIFVAESGDIYFAGCTSSSSGIHTSGVHQTSYAGGGFDVFLVKLNSSGARQWATYYGGPSDDRPSGVSVNSSGEVFVAGYTVSTSGIATSGAYQTALGGNYEGYAAKFSSSGSLLWGTYYGGSEYDYVYATTTDNSGNLYLVGSTNSTAGISTSGAYQTSLAGGYDAFVVKINSSGTPQWCSYYGGTGNEQGRGISIDGSQNLYLTGLTTSTSSISTSGAHQTSHGGGSNDAFVMKLNNSGTRQWATYNGSSGSDIGVAISSDASGAVVICGNTASSSGMSTSWGHQTSSGGSTDAFVASYTSSGVLPVQLISFEAFLLPSATVRCVWATASEVNNCCFEVEKSLDGNEWKLVGGVSGRGNTFNTNNYEFIDNFLNRDNQPSLVYYRLKQIDFNGEFTYSDIRTVHIKPIASVVIYPNPGNGNITLRWSEQLSGEALTVEIIDAIGRKVRSYERMGTDRQIKTGLPRGTYLVLIKQVNGTTCHRQYISVL